MAISVVIPTFDRCAMLERALTQILLCDPPPNEVLVQIDAGDAETCTMLAQRFAGRVAWEQNVTTLGPGGSRNLMIQRARHPWIVSFDDDSWPLDRDFFARAESLLEGNPRVAVVGCDVSLPGQVPSPPTGALLRSASNFENCGCVIRRDAFLATRGYIPLRHAYGMEELDVSLQLLDLGWEISFTRELRVFHDTCMEHHASRAVNAAHITNTALLGYLRYPMRYWPYAMLQTLNRVRFAVGTGRLRGVVSGLVRIPATCWKFRALRRPVKPKTIRRALAHR